MPTPRENPGTATVVGGGPAGLIAAEVLAAAGHRVTVHEHMASVGRKLLLAGRGGLNITHSEPLEVMLDRYGPQREQLEPALRDFGPDDLRAWCAGLQEPTFVGSSGRVFPASFKATPLLRAWLRRLDRQGVEFRTRHRWLGWRPAGDGAIDGHTSVFSRADGSTIDVVADITVFALGGASWPRVGSDGGWVEEFTRARVAVTALRPANCGLVVGWTDEFAARFAGEPLKNVAVGSAGHSVRGDAMVTAAGLEGGPIYAHSAAVRGELEKAGCCTIEVDLQPDLSQQRLTDRLAERRRPKDSLSTWLRRSGFAPVSIGLLREATGNRLPNEPAALGRLAKAVPVPVVSTMPIDRAISTAGGVEFAELDESYMLRRMPGTFVAGEMLDWEAPTGGYLLQASFASAVAAARGAVEWLSRRP